MNADRRGNMDTKGGLSANSMGASSKPVARNNFGAILRKDDNTAKIEFVEKASIADLMKKDAKGRTMLNHAINHGNDIVRATILRRFGIDFVESKGELQNMVNRSGPLLEIMIECLMCERARAVNVTHENILRTEEFL